MLMPASGTPGVSLNQLEYAYAVEDFSPDADFIKVYIPKLMGNVVATPNSEKQNLDRSTFANSSKCKVTGSSSVTSQGYILARVVDKRNHTHPHLFCNNPYYGTDNCPNRSHHNNCHHPSNSILANCTHDHWHYDFNNEPVGGGNIPAGAKLIVMFIDGNLTDCWVTRFICHYPGNE